MKTLLHYLNSSTPQLLRQISEAWEANLSDRLTSGNAFELNKEMQAEFLQRRIFATLTEPELQFLQSLLEKPDYSFSKVALIGALKNQSEFNQFEATLKTLQKKGLVFEEHALADAKDPAAIMSPVKDTSRGWATIYNNSRRGRTEYAYYKIVETVPRELARPFVRFLAERNLPNPNRFPLKTLLERLEPEVLETLAANWSILTLLGGVEPVQLATELSRAMSDEQQQKTILAELPLESRELFATLQKNGTTTIAALLKEYVSYRRLGRSLRPLTENFLVWQAFEGQNVLVFVPEEIAKPLAKNPPAQKSLQTVAPPSDATSYPPYALAWDLLTVVNYIGQHNIELTAKSYIPKRELKKIAALLWVTEPGEPLRLDYILRLAWKLDLLQLDDNRQKMEFGEGLAEWLKLDFYDQLRRLCEIWLEDGRRFGPVEYPYYYSSLRLINAGNRKMLDWLAEASPGTWVSFEALLQKVRKETPYFIVPRVEMIKSLGPQQVLEHDKHWMDYEGEIIQRTFGRVLEWLGIIKVGRNERGKVVAYSLTEWGAEVCQQPGAVRQTLLLTEKPLLVQPNFEVMLFAPQVATLWMLQKFATLKKLDQVSLFTLSKEGLLRGLESGLRPTEIVEWLTAHNPQPLPQNLLISIQDWSKGFRRVAVANLTLLEVEDPAMLDELMSSKQFSEYFVRRVAPNAAVVQLPDTASNRRVDPLKTFKSRLKTAGFYAD